MTALTAHLPTPTACTDFLVVVCMAVVLLVAGVRETRRG